MQKGITKQQEENCLDTQAHIVKGVRGVENIEVLAENIVETARRVQDALERATELNKPRRKWSEETRRREKAKRGEG